MGKVTDALLKGISGRIGNLVFYQENGETFVRKAPGKQSKEVKAKTSELKRISQDVMRQTHGFLRNFKHILKFGYQEWSKGAKKPYHEAVSFTSKHSFVFRDEVSAWKILDPSLVKFSRGGLPLPEEAWVEREEGGIRFSWKNVDLPSSAKPTDQAFLILVNENLINSVWEFHGATRENESHFLAVPFLKEEERWHAYLAFSQENLWTKKRTFSDTLYLGMV